MDEAGLCDRVALIQEGSILQADETARITSTFAPKVFAIRDAHMYHLLQALEHSPHMHSVYPFGEDLHYIDKRTSIGENGIKAYLAESGFDEAVVKPIEPGIEDVFMELASKETTPS